MTFMVRNICFLFQKNMTEPNIIEIVWHGCEWTLQIHLYVILAAIGSSLPFTPGGSVIGFTLPIPHAFQLPF